MYNFKIERKKVELTKIRDILTDREFFVFNLLSTGVSREETYKKTKEVFNISTATYGRIINRIKNKLESSKTFGDLTYKVYMHVFPDGKKYVGVCQYCKDRWNSGVGYSNNKDMYAAIQKYGWDNIEHKILFETTSSIDAYKVESILIEELDLVKNGYNLR